MRKSWLEVDLPALLHNAAVIRGRFADPGRTGIIAVLKADAYGHGLQPVARFLARNGLDDFAVAGLEEALVVRAAAPGARILVLGGIGPGEADEFRVHRLTAAHFDDRPFCPGVDVELKIDTGMGRLGVPWEMAAQRAAPAGPSLKGIFSHFGCAETDAETTHVQIRRFTRATQGLSCRRHLANSAGLLLYPSSHFDAVRSGLLLYGLSPVGPVPELRPALSWTTHVLTVRDIPAGRAVGYGAAYTTQRASRIGVLPVGYADGYRLALSNRGETMVRGQAAPVVGRVSMDFISVDLTDIPGACTGDPATLVSNDPDSPASLHRMAQLAGTLPYEILTTLGPRSERVYRGEESAPLVELASRASQG